MGMIRKKENRYVPGRQPHYVDLARNRSSRPYVNRRDSEGNWSHTAPGGDEHPGDWQKCELGCRPGHDGPRKQPLYQAIPEQPEYKCRAHDVLGCSICSQQVGLASWLPTHAMWRVPPCEVHSYLQAGAYAGTCTVCGAIHPNSLRFDRPPQSDGAR